ncbi:MAG: DNA polymerase IV [Defluviitaleaceae bacterium]|nr:DNA polymerase IV [Defluviitaleaceae bacterium]
MKAVIHCDMDNYYAAVEEKYNPALRGVPFAVCGDPKMRHSIVMSKNHLAKKAGVMTGISFRQARKICPKLGYVQADLGKYLEQTKQARAIYYKYTDDVIPYGMDEAWLDMGEMTLREAEQIAELIRVETRYTMGLSASLGVSDNLIFSKIGSDYKKPNSITVITRENYREIVWPMPASTLLFIGNQRKKLLHSAGITTIGDIANADPDFLEKLLGKSGYDIHRYANGDDRTFVPNSEEIGSIGNTITPPADLRTKEDVSAVLYLLATTVCARLRKHNLQASCIAIHLRDAEFNKTTRQCSFKMATDSVNYVFNRAYDLFQRHYPWERPLRSIGIRADNLDSMGQLTLDPNEEPPLAMDIDRRIKELTDRIGPLEVEKGGVLRV